MIFAMAAQLFFPEYPSIIWQYQDPEKCLTIGSDVQFELLFSIINVLRRLLNLIKQCSQLLKHDVCILLWQVITTTGKDQHFALFGWYLYVTNT